VFLVLLLVFDPLVLLDALLMLGESVVLGASVLLSSLEVLAEFLPVDLAEPGCFCLSVVGIFPPDSWKSSDPWPG
jgi:hypothetical protein